MLLFGAVVYVGVPTMERLRTDELVVAVGLKGPRTRQLLNELVAMGVVEYTAATKNRRYIKK